MSATLETPSMARPKKGRPKRSQRKDAVVKIEEAIVEKARFIVLMRKTTLAEFFSELLRGPVDREYAKEAKRIHWEEGPK